MMIACFLLVLLCVLSILGLTVCTPERPVEYFVFSVLSAAVTITEFVTAVVGVAPPQAFSVDGWNSVFGCKRSKVYVEGGGGGELGTGEYNPNSLMVRRLRRQRRRKKKKEEEGRKDMTRERGVHRKRKREIQRERWEQRERKGEREKAREEEEGWKCDEGGLVCIRTCSVCVLQSESSTHHLIVAAMDDQYWALGL